MSVDYDLCIERRLGIADENLFFEDENEEIGYCL